MVNRVADVQVISTGAAVGAKVRGLDLAHPVPEETKALLREAMYRTVAHGKAVILG